MRDEVRSLRQSSRDLVRELGFLEREEAATKLSHSHVHALIEIEARGTARQAELPGVLRLDKSTTSRVVAELEARGWVRARASRDDARARVLGLTTAGRATVKLVHRQANARVERALAVLDADQRRIVLEGMQLYARALERSRRRGEYTIRPIKSGDRAGVATLMRTVQPEFGASGVGFSISDLEVDDMPSAYRAPRCGYFVVTRPASSAKERARGRRGELVVGGGGFAPLRGGEKDTCELRKMYFYPEVRGLGIGQELLTLCIAEARRAGFSRMYLETLANMTAARALYMRNGFSPIEGPLGSTGHFGCNAFFVRDL